MPLCNNTQSLGFKEYYGGETHISTNSDSGRFEITDGPTSDRIWDSAKYACDSRNGNVPVRFTVRTNKMNEGNVRNTIEISPRITGVSHADNSGESLVIEGHLARGAPCQGQYNSRTRTGFIEIEFDT